MKHVYLENKKEEEDFVLKAARYFKDNPEHKTFTEGVIEAGDWFAVRSI